MTASREIPLTESFPPKYSSDKIHGRVKMAANKGLKTGQGGAMAFCIRQGAGFEIKPPGREKKVKITKQTHF